jgi:hypothetical protein
MAFFGFFFSRGRCGVTNFFVQGCLILLVEIPRISPAFPWYLLSTKNACKVESNYIVWVAVSIFLGIINCSSTVMNEWKARKTTSNICPCNFAYFHSKLLQIFIQEKENFNLYSLTKQLKPKRKFNTFRMLVIYDI